MKPQSRTNFQFLLVLKKIVIFVKDVLRILYMGTFMLLYACVQRHARVCIWQSEVNFRCLSRPAPLPHLCFEAGSPAEPGAHQWASELQESAFLLFPSWDNRCLPRSPAFYKGAWNPNSSPLACTAHSISSQPFPLSWSWLGMTEPYRDWAVAAPFTCVNLLQRTVYPVPP